MNYAGCGAWPPYMLMTLTMNPAFWLLHRTCGKMSVHGKSLKKKLLRANTLVKTVKFLLHVTIVSTLEVLGGTLYN